MTPALSAASAVAAPALRSSRRQVRHGVGRYAAVDNPYRVVMFLLYHIVGVHGMGKGCDFYACLQE